MRLTRIGRNTVLRLALIYAGMFSASILLLFGFIYWRTGGYLARQTDDLILADVEDLTEVYAAGGTTGLVDAIADHLQEDLQGRLLYLLEDSAAHRLAGNLGRWPAVSSADGWVDFTVPSPRTPAKRSRPARARLVAFSDDVRLLVGRDIYSERRLTSSILQALGWGLALTLALGALGGIVTSSRHGAPPRGDQSHQPRHHRRRSLAARSDPRCGRRVRRTRAQPQPHARPHPGADGDGQGGVRQRRPRPADADGARQDEAGERSAPPPRANTRPGWTRRSPASIRSSIPSRPC